MGISFFLLAGVASRSALVLLMTNNDVRVDVCPTTQISLKLLRSWGRLIRCHELMQMVVMVSVKGHWRTLRSIYVCYINWIISIKDRYVCRHRTWGIACQQEASTSVSCELSSLVTLVMAVVVTVNSSVQLTLRSPDFFSFNLAVPWEVESSAVVLLLVGHLESRLSTLRLPCLMFHHFRSFFDLLLVAEVLHFEVHLCLILRLGATMHLLLLLHALWRVVMLH